MNKATTKKEKAIELMKKLDIYKPYIRGFEKSRRVCFLKTTAASGLTRSRLFYQKSKNWKKNTTVLYML